MDPKLLLTRHHGLSKREHDVFCLWAMNFTVKEIARIMQLSVHTVDTYLLRMKRKMRLSNKSDAIKFLLENNLRLYCFSVEQSIFNQLKDVPPNSVTLSNGIAPL
jgi:DNA-binding CsgD family transcriptional regulator